MPEFEESEGFKLKSGNKTSFKKEIVKGRKKRYKGDSKVVDLDPGYRFTKKKKYVTKKSKEEGGGKTVGIKKYRKSGDLKKQVTKQDGRRTVTKIDKSGKKTTKSRRTLKGIITGKGSRSGHLEHLEHPTG